MSIRHLTGSACLLSLVNRLGHCASANTVITLETSLAELQLSSQPVPKGFAESVPTIAVWDNIDFGEETRSGAGTTHHTNGILVQAKVRESPETTQRQPLKKGICSLNPPIKEIEQYFLRAKRGPSPPESVRDCANDPEMSQTFRTALQLEMACGMCKILSVSLSSIPSWSAFHCLLNRQKKFDKSAMHYLPVIEHPPTELSTVKEILNRSSDRCDRLKLDCMVLVFDQAIYSKVQQIRWTDDDLFGRFVVHLGDFHTTMSFLSVIGKRFVDSGLKDVFIESRIIAEGSLTGVMNGHQYNRSIQAHKITLDALM